MSMHWQGLDTTGKIEAIKRVWTAGFSAAEIAAHFEGATRNAVVGMYNRYGERLLAGHPLRAPGFSRRDASGKPARIAGPRPLKTSKPIPAAEIIPDRERHIAGKPLTMLARKECKWPVNDAAVGEVHLFCGEPSEGSYCPHHSMRSVSNNVPNSLKTQAKSAILHGPTGG